MYEFGSMKIEMRKRKKKMEKNTLE